MTDLLVNLPKIKINPDTYRELPESAGIYVFFSKGLPIYIGKAINLKRRVSSYFEINLESKTARMIKAATELSFIQVGSELEALLLEARLIRTYMPKYNIAAKDDKHPLYIQITKEMYPRVLTARKLDDPTSPLRPGSGLRGAKKIPTLAFYGPFPSSSNVRSVLKMIRRIFPYSDHKLGKRGCLYSHIGLCNPCPSEIEKISKQKLRTMKRNEYMKNIKWVKAVLSAKFDGVRKELVKEMSGLSRDKRFEEAAKLRNKIRALDYITQPQMPTEFYIQNPNLYEDIRARELEELKKILVSGFVKIENLKRIECFDVAHLAGTHSTASMVTFVNGEADKNLYRHFRIRQKKGNSDIDSLREVIKRRITHLGDPTSLLQPVSGLRGASWGRPDLIIVDGGTAQVKAFTKILSDNKVEIPVVGIAKNPDRLIIENQKIKLQGVVLQLLSKIRDEAHRFARKYHHNLIFRSLVN